MRTFNKVMIVVFSFVALGAFIVGVWMLWDSTHQAYLDIWDGIPFALAEFALVAWCVIRAVEIAHD